MASSFKKDQSKIRSFNWYRYVTVEKDIRGGTCHSIHWYAKAKKDYDKNKEMSYL